MSKDDQDDVSERVDVNAQVYEEEGSEETIVIAIDVGNGEQEFCVVDFVDIEEGLFAILTPRDQFYDVENPEWDMYIFGYRVTEDDQIELEPIDDELGKRVMLEYEGISLLEEMAIDPEVNPFRPNTVDE